MVLDKKTTPNHNGVAPLWRLKSIPRRRDPFWRSLARFGSLFDQLWVSFSIILGPQGSILKVPGSFWLPCWFILIAFGHHFGLFSLYFNISLYLSLFLSVSLSISLYFPPFLCISPYFFQFLSISPYFCPFPFLDSILIQNIQACIVSKHVS